jgi:hypothetical protein
MAIIYSYPINHNVLLSDIIVGTTTAISHGRPKNQTKSFEISDLAPVLAPVMAPLVVGPGTINMVAKFSTASSITDSMIEDNGASVIIGRLPNTLSAYTLDVNGTIFCDHVTSNSFIKTGGTSKQSLMADGSTTTPTLSKSASLTYQTVAGSSLFYSDAINSSEFAQGDILRINTVTTLSALSVGVVTTQYFINSSPSLTGATQIAQYQGAGAGVLAEIYLPMSRFYWVYNNRLYGRNFLSSTSNSDNATASFNDSVAIPTTQFYIIVLINTTSTDRASLSSFQVRKT